MRGGLHLVEHQGRRFALCGGFGLGAPAAGLVVEQLAALGTRQIITVGTAASRQHNLRPGALVACTSALRDEGLSHHYLPPGRTASPSPALTRHLTEALAPYDVLFTSGPVWTMDAPYRETTVEVSRYGADGILAADMEAAAGLRRGPLPYGRRRHRRGHRGLPRRPPPAPALAGHRARPSRRTGGSGTGTSRLHRVTADLRRTLGLNSS